MLAGGGIVGIAIGLAEALRTESNSNISTRPSTGVDAAGTAQDAYPHPIDPTWHLPRPYASYAADYGLGYSHESMYSSDPSSDGASAHAGGGLSVFPGHSDSTTGVVLFAPPAGPAETSRWEDSDSALPDGEQEKGAGLAMRSTKRRRMIWLVMAIVIFLVVGGIAGGVAGGLVAKRNRHRDNAE